MTEDADEVVSATTLSITNPLIFPLVPQAARAPVAALWALDRRLARIARDRGEVILRQIKLRWWADQLGQIDVTTPAEPLLQRIADHVLPTVTATQLEALAEAWLTATAAQGDAEIQDCGRLLFTMTASMLAANGPACADAGAAWARVDGALHDASLQHDWRAISDEINAAARVPTPRALTALMALARQIARRGGMRSPVREQFAIFRAGLFGR